MLLNVHTHYSLRYGTLSPDALIDALPENGYTEAVITDINNTSITLEMVRRCRKLHPSFKMIPGMEFREGDTLRYIAIAKNAEGFCQINDYRTRMNMLQQELPERAPALSQVYFIYPYGEHMPKDLHHQERIGVFPWQLPKLALEKKQFRQNCVVLSPVTLAKSTYSLHCQLRAIDHNILISHLKPEQAAKRDEILYPKKILLERYMAFPELILNTDELLASCDFQFDFKSPKNKKTFTGDSYQDIEILQKKAMKGLQHRYGLHDTAAKERVLHELKIIEQLGFASYFLITDDICNYARHRNFHYVGRGSGANSAVAYCLGITNVCPLDLKLPFERFLNPKRQSPPDFDVDFSWQDRDAIYDYIFAKYPKGQVALMGAMGTFKGRSILRELGKVYGLPKQEIDRLVLHPEDSRNHNKITQKILASFNKLADFPNQRSIHASGMLISELPLTSYAAMDLPPKGYPTIQIDMYVAEDINFEKFDILSQRGIGHINDCAKIIEENTGQKIDSSDGKKFFDDPLIAEKLKKGETVGCFYIESPAMRQLIRKLKCENYLTLVAASSIIRPGVASSGMMGEYIRRHLKPETTRYIHPVFKEQLEETYGIMVYQEDVMKIGHAYGGLNMADADVLRRMMSGKYRNKKHLEEIEDKYFAHCENMGYPKENAEEVWRQMESFAGYCFNKAHSASYAVESYQSLYLKTYFPREFIVSVLNNYGGFYPRKVYINEAKKAGATICLPCINTSEYQAIILGKNLFLGFDRILGIESNLVQNMLKERHKNGKFSGLENFIYRTGIKLEQLVLLIRSGALRSLGRGKKELLWEAHLQLSNGSKNLVENAPLFTPNSEEPLCVLPPLEEDPIEDLYDEIELFGFPISGSYFDMLKTSFRGDIFAKDFAKNTGRKIKIIGELIDDKRVKTRRGDMMKFGTFFDAKGDFFDTVHFAPSLSEYPLYGEGVYLMEGVVVEDFEVEALEVLRCKKLGFRKDPRSE